MKRIVMLLLGAAACVCAAAQTPVSLKIEVKASTERFYAGPYAKYAEKYLGLTAAQNSCTSTEITSVVITTEEKGSAPAPLSFSKGEQGSDRADYSSVPLLRSSVGQRSIEMAAAKAADQILDIRGKRYQILTGDTDMSLTGESLALTLKEFDREEKELLKLFLGYTERLECSNTFFLTPSADNAGNIYVAFRIGDNALLPAEHLEGRMVTLELTPTNLPDESAAQETPAKKKKQPKAPKGMKWQSKTEFVPAECSLKLRDGVNVLLQGTVSIPQLGYSTTYDVLVPVEKK